MIRNLLLFFYLISFFSLSMFGQTSSNLNTPKKISAEYVNGDILIKFKSVPGQQKAIDMAKQQLITKYKSKVVKQWKIGAEHWKVDTLLNNYNLSQIIDSLNSNPFVEYAEPNYIIRADVIPNDPSYGDQWALNNTGQDSGTPDADIDAPEAWDITTGDTNIIVGILDSGIDYNHPDLAENIWTNWDEIPDNGIDDDNNGYIDDIHGWNFVYNNNDPMDDYSHGTHVAGTIGAVSNNGIGVTGVAWNVRLMALKFIDWLGGGSTSGAISAVEYATANGAKLTNNSWGGGAYSQSLYDAIARADTAGVLFIASSGNETKDNDRYSTFPANYELPNIITVASTDRNDTISTFSNLGLVTVDIAAPGTSILSTLPNNTYGYLSGTSMAAPHVSGGIALAWAQFPGFSSHQIKNQILGSSDQKEYLVGLMNSSSILNLYNAVVDTNMISIETNLLELEFGALLIGNQSEQKEILITNILDNQIIIDSIVCETDFYITRNSTFTNFIPSFSINPNQVDTITVVFDPSNEGVYNKRCQIYYKTSGLLSKTVTVFLNGYGVGNGTIINAGTVSGIWEKALSPYIINGNISIEASNTLNIESGVNVLFAGYYNIVVSDNSTLIANGSENDSIYFQAIDTLVGWAGMDLINKQNVDSLSYCVFKNSNATLFSDENQPPDYLGGAMCIYYSSPTISNCSFENNAAELGLGGAMYVHGYSYPILKNLNFLNNKASSGGAIYYSGTEFDTNNIVLSNIAFVNNIADYDGAGSGGALYSAQARLILTNITFYNNSASTEGGAMFMFTDSYIELKNSILFGNTAPDGSEISFGSEYVPSTMFVEHSNIDTNSSNWYYHSADWSDLDYFEWGIGNTSVDPLFVDVNTNNLSLSSNSSCIDAGNPNDNVGEEPFPNGYRINMGFEGGTNYAALTTEPGLAIIPNPLDFGKISVNETKQLPLYIKNGSPVTINISDISLSDTSKFKISADYITSNILYSGDIDSVLIDFSSEINIDSLYQSSIIIKTNETSDYTLPAEGYVIIGTNIISNNVSGIWSIEGSPYNIYNDISVETNNSLLIEPGVIVRFMGKFNLSIGDLCQFTAHGNQDSSIYFTAFDTIDGWYGIDIVDSGNDDIFEYCNLSRGNVDGTSPNDRGGALYITNSDPVIKNSILENNSGNYASAIYLNSSNANFQNVEIRNNNGNDNGTISINSNSNVIFESCAIYNNYCGGYGGGFAVWDNSVVSIKNSLIYDNVGTSCGGGISIMNSSVDLVNVSMINNMTGWRGNEIILINNAHISLGNSIIYNNYNNIDLSINEYITDIYLDSYSNSSQNTLNISYSSIDTLKSNFINYQPPINAIITWGDGNTTLNPQFADINNWNLKLDSISPCIDSGDSTSNFANSDIEGNPRILLNTIDMGAYEWGNYWTGSENASWSNPLNWKDNTVPDSTSVLTIPPTQNYINWPVIQSNQKAGKVFLKEGAVLEINNGGVLEVGDDNN